MYLFHYYSLSKRKISDDIYGTYSEESKLFKVAKRILHYLKGTINFSLFYSVSNDYKLVGYSDSNQAGDTDDRKSTTGFAFFMGDTAFTQLLKK